MLIRYLTSLCIIFLAVATLATLLHADEGKVISGTYFAPTGHFSITYPIKQEYSFKFCKSPEKECVAIAYKNCWENEGLWVAGFMVLPLDNLSVEQFEIGAKRDLSQVQNSYFDSPYQPKHQYTKSLTVHGRPAFQAYYTGIHQLQLAGLLSTLVLLEDSSIANFELLFKLDDIQSSNYLERYQLFMNSFKKL